MAPKLGDITVLGVGNPIMADDAIGLELLASVQSSVADPEIEFVDGGTGGMELLPTVQDAKRLLILDAVAGPTPGAVIRLDGDQVPRMLSTKLSPHQVGLLDVFAAARLLGKEPGQVVVVGITPGLVEIKIGLSDAVAAAIEPATRTALEVLDEWR
jgi:hydrogenase maturation protease